MTGSSKALFKLAATSGAIAAADPEPFSKAAIASLAVGAGASIAAAEQNQSDKEGGAKNERNWAGYRYGFNYNVAWCNNAR